MENDLQSQYVARSVTQEWIANQGRERVRLERMGLPISSLLKTVRRIIAMS